MRLDDGVLLRVDEFVQNIVWRCERGSPIGANFGDRLYIAVSPPFADGRKIRILYGDDAKKRRVDFHALSLVSAAAAT